MTTTVPYELMDLPRLGVIVLSTDETLEYEFRNSLAGSSIHLMHARIPAQAEVTPEALETMADAMTHTAALLPSGLRAVAYACTSGSTVIGEDRVTGLVQAAHPGVPVTNPLTAVKAALNAVKAHRIALVSPYVATVTAPLRAALKSNGVEVVGEVSFDQSHDQTVARISESSTLAAIHQVTTGQKVDAVFCSCTNLRSFGILAQAEAELGVPVISSNSALLWHLGKLAGVEINGPGWLFGEKDQAHGG